MPVHPTYPGVYIEEIPSGVHTITGVVTSITAFIGRTLCGPVNKATTIQSYADFERIFGGLWPESKVSYAVQDFYNNGGNTAIIVRLFSPTQEDLEAARETAISVSEVADTSQTPSLKTLVEAMRQLADQARTKAAYLAADAVASAAKAEEDRTFAAVRQAATETAQNLNTAAKAVATTKDTASPSTANSTAGAMREAVETTDPGKTAGDIIASAAAKAAKANNATPDSVINAAKDAVNDLAKTLQTVIDAEDKASSPTGQSTAAAIRNVANTVKDNKAAADLVAKAAVAEASETATSDSVRHAAKDAAAAYNKNLPVTKAQIKAGGLPLIAAYEGSWGGNLRVTLDHHNISDDVAKAYEVPSDKLFNLTVTNIKTGRSEKFLNLTVLDHPQRIDKVLEAESELIRWGRLDSSGALSCPTEQDMPTFNGNSNELYDEVKTDELALEAANKRKLDDQSLGKTNALVTDQKAIDDAKTSLDQKKSMIAISDGNEITVNEFIGPGTQEHKWGLYALEQVDLFNLLCIPPYRADNNVDPDLIAAAAAYCEKRRAMLLVDPPSGWKNKETAREQFTAIDHDAIGTKSRNSALFFPRLKRANPSKNNQMEEFVPCGAVAGIFARTDAQRGVWKAPAGLDATLVGVPQLTVNLTDAENGELNPLGINCLRSFPIYGRVVWGARTLRGADSFTDEYKYISVRRTALFIEESLYRGTQWVVFEPNDEPLWAQIRLNVGAFMHNLFRLGAFQGKTPREAYLVKCDNETTTQNDIDLGVVNILVAFAPLKPAEFVVIKIQQLAGKIEV